MAKLTTQIIEDLYSYGKSVYDRKIGLSDATDAVVSKYKGQIAEASASFYIGLYSEYISGKGSTWNQNSELVLYYVEHITTERGIDIGRKAYQAGMKFAKSKTKRTLIKDLNLLWSSLSNEDPSSVPAMNELEFEQWLRTNPEKSYVENTIKRYIRALKKIEEWLNIKLTMQVLDISDIAIFSLTEQEIKAVPDFNKINQDHGHGDLSAALALYRKFLDSLDGNIDSEEEEGEGHMPVSVKEVIHNINEYIVAKGFSYSDNLIENFFLCLKSKPFVILAGTSGTGKTRLVRLFAEAIGATAVNGRYCQVAVRPDWSDSTDLFGHLDLNGNFVPGAILPFLKAATDDPKHPYILCLDEMNLARVEYYMSDFLSIIESRDLKDGEITSDLIMTLDKYGGKEGAEKKYGEIGFPQNLYIVGTVNMDETTFPFSRKVLDRANTIEFNYVDLGLQFSETLDVVEPYEADNSFLMSEYLVLGRDCQKYFDVIGPICAQLESINKILRKANAHVGYRVRDEIVFYLINNMNADLLTREEAFDNSIMQKILPRIQGSSASIKTMLCELFESLSGQKLDANAADTTTASSMQKIIDGGTVKYPKSADKIKFMVQRFEEDGFTSYWL